MVALPELSMIAGIGTDLLSVKRIERAYARHGFRFVQRILGQQEIDVFKRRYERDANRGIRFLATRFAAKEAFSKAIGLGMHSPMEWRLMQTLNSASGKPQVKLGQPLAAWYDERFGTAHISLSDERDMVMAFAVVEARA